MGDEGHDPLMSREGSHDTDARPGKRQRSFIARQACEACRAKKTRCDEDMPCSLCRSLGIECTYAERKPTKKEVSMSMIFNTLKRMETKIDHLSTPDSPHPRHGSESIRSEPGRPIVESPYRVEAPMSIASITSPQPQSTGPLSQPANVLSFSAHQTVHWPGVVSTLPPSLVSSVHGLERTYPTLLESGRPQLDPIIPAQASIPGVDWIASLSLSCVKELSNAYFETFNRVYPFIDRDFYFLSTLAVVVREGFGYDIESCLVLNVMALGCMGLRAFEEGGFDASGHLDSISPIVRQIMDEEIPGLSFFNEARRRVGFCLTERDIQSCQYYLVSAVFFAQLMRPVDEWMMTNRAAITCVAFFKCPPESHDEWFADMQSRLFWTALVLETVIVQELELPPSRLKEWEDVVPLPKFTIYPYADKSRPRNTDDSYYHYHFLAQIAHRIILSRIRDELYYSNPSAALADELRHQLEQWRDNLPQAIQWTSEGEDQTFDCPADAVVVTLLQARYRISIFHLGRPFLYKAIQKPMSVNQTDLKMCSEALQFAMDWPLALDVCARMKSFMPLKYFATGQMFGQLFIFHAFKNSPNPRVRDVLPMGYEVWCTKMLRFMSELVESSPTFSKDFELLSALYHLAEV